MIRAPATRTTAAHDRQISGHAGAADVALLERLIDYAGLFPPARLPLDQAFARYRQYREEDHRWLLARFVINAARLRQLADLLSRAGEPTEPLHLSLLVGGGATSIDDLRSRLEADLSELHLLLDQHRDRIVIDALELSLPVREPQEVSATALQSLLHHLATRIDQARLASPPVFVEWSVATGAETADRKLIAALAEHAASAGESGPNLAFKLRCGAETAASIPPPERVAAVIAQCRDKGLMMKCTAGLHHPLRHHDEQLGALRHGFLNVFGAGVLAHCCGLDQQQLLTCLQEQEPGRLELSRDHFSWNGFDATAAAIQAARAALITSFGSCSFDEPRDHLHHLGLLPQPPQAASRQGDSS